MTTTELPSTRMFEMAGTSSGAAHSRWLSNSPPASTAQHLAIRSGFLVFILTVPSERACSCNSETKRRMAPFVKGWNRPRHFPL
jgi:hypothetical protein